MSENHTISGYLGQEFQLKLFWQLLTEPEFAEKVIEGLNVDYFDDIGLKRLFIIMFEYFKEYKKPPNLQNNSIQLAIKKFNKSSDPTDEEILNANVKKIKNWNDMVLNNSIDYDGEIIQNETFIFIKQQEYRKLALFINEKTKTGQIKSQYVIYEIEDKLKKINNIGDDEDYGHEIGSMIDKVLKKGHREPIPTSIKIIDELMGGGLGKGEIGIILAASGVGKSTILTKIANSGFEEGKNVLQIIFEDKVEDIMRKHFTIWSGVPLDEIDDNPKYIKEIVDNKLNDPSRPYLTIKRFNQENTTIKDVQKFIEKYKKKFGITYDMIVLDYLDCLEPHVKATDQNQAELAIIKAFEGMSGDYNIPMWTALQANRTGFDAEIIGAQQMGGNIKRAQKTHFLMSIGKSPEQKIHNTANISILKARFASDGHVFRDCIYNNKTMQIEVTDNMPEYKTQNLKKYGDDDVKKLQDSVVNLHSNVSNAMITENTEDIKIETTNDLVKNENFNNEINQDLNTNLDSNISETLSLDIGVNINDLDNLKSCDNLSNFLNNSRNTQNNIIMNE